MTAPRTARRLAIVPLTALAVALPALPALASTSYMAGCSVAPGDYSQSLPNEAPLSHTGDHTSVSVDPQAETIRASAALGWNGTPAGDGCDVVAKYSDLITVRGPAGGTVEIQAVIRFVGNVTTSGTGAPLHSAEADADATYSLRPQWDFDSPDVLFVTGSAQAHDRQVDSSPDDYSRFSHSIQVNGDVVDSSAPPPDYASTARAFDVGPKTATFTVPVGTVLESSMSVTPSAVVFDGEGSASATVQEFSVKLTTATPGAWLDRGDGPAPTPDPQPEPTPTALQNVQDARAKLASYGIHSGVSNALDKKLEHAQRDIVAGADACDDLASFAAQLSAQRGKKVTAAQADQLAGLITTAQGQLGC